MKCPGFDDNGRGFACDGKPGTPWTPIWCLPCDERRRARITRQLQDILASLTPGDTQTEDG